jgi:hypothetical protein
MGNTPAANRLLHSITAAAIVALAMPALAQTEPAQPDPSQPDSTTPKSAPGKKKKGAAPDPSATPAAGPDGTPAGSAPGAPGAPGSPGQGAKPGAAPAPAAPAAPVNPGPIVPRGPGPWDHDLLIARLPPVDPMTGPAMGFSAAAETKVFERGGVACLARDCKGRIIAAFQWFPQINPGAFDKIAMRTSTDEGKTWSGARIVTVTGLPPGAIRPCDPTLVLLDDGRLRLYFTSQVPGSKCATYSAVSPASDGMMFSFEQGVRFGDPGRDVLDCTVAKLGDTWHYFAPIDQADPQGRVVGYHAVSKDGLTFEARPNVTIDAPTNPKAAQAHASHHRWLGSALATSDGKTLRFVGTNDGGGIWAAHSINGSDWKLDDLPLKSGADPAAIELKDGSLLVIATGPARPGTPSAKGQAGQR